MVRNTSWCKPEVWGGLECTINRIGDQFQDQLEYSGHYDRENDIDLIAESGISSIRFPILWEKHQPQLDFEIDWQWADAQLQKIRAHNIVPIAGLMHHGSGPAYTSLLDKKFPKLLADYAESVARRFPFLEYYTPINEPLTTARFSGLYRHWYPHHSNALSFARMVLIQTKGIVLSMRAIRKINPAAKLIQTEDLGKVYSTEKLKYQARFENERRWLTFDLLCGKVNENHRMWKYFIKLGIKPNELEYFLNNPCPPDILGLNHYVTSERFLDDDIESYPDWLIGGNRKHRYADLEAVRIDHNESSGLKILLEETWDRYHLPLAITEVQLHCHREDQLRWFSQVWDSCLESCSKGIEIKAVTAWSMMGAFGWNKLLTKGKGDYESGVFDLRSGEPRKTALFGFLRALSKKEHKEFPFLHEPGWWQRDTRFLKPSQRREESNRYSERPTDSPLLIIGKRGTLGRAFARICERRGLSYRLLGREEIDITNEKSVEDAINKYKPWAVVNAAGFVRVDEAEIEQEQCFLVNTTGPLNLAKACRQKGIGFMTFSSDLVFDGQKTDPYTETDQVLPLSIYGQSKAESEKKVMSEYSDALVIRTSAFFGPWDHYNFVSNVLDVLGKKEVFPATDGILISPTYVPDLVNYSLDLLIDEEKNIWHLSNKGSISWYDLANEVAARGGRNQDYIRLQSIDEMAFRAPRPVYSVLRSNKGALLPPLENALSRYFDEKANVA